MREQWPALGLAEWSLGTYINYQPVAQPSPVKVFDELISCDDGVDHQSALHVTLEFLRHLG